MLQRPPRHLQHQALLRVHGDCFAWRDSEKLGVEAIDVAQESTPAGVHLAGRIRIRVVEGVGVPALRRRSEEHTSELQSLMSNSYDDLCLQKKNQLTT